METNALYGTIQVIIPLITTCNYICFKWTEYVYQFITTSNRKWFFIFSKIIIHLLFGETMPVVFLGIDVW